MQKHSGMSINITNHYDFDPAIPLPRIISYSASMCRMICTMLFTAVPCSSICNSKCMPLLGLNEFLYIIPENTTPLSEWESSSLADERQSSRYIRNPDSEAPLQTSGIRILRITKPPDDSYAPERVWSPDPSASYSWSLQAWPPSGFLLFLYLPSSLIYTEGLSWLTIILCVSLHVICHILIFWPLLSPPPGDIHC